MFEYICRPLAMALLLAGIAAAPATYAQRVATGLAPHVDLEASLQESGLTQGESPADFLGPKVLLSGTPAPGEKLFEDAPPTEGGWKGLAKLLEAISPGVDTALPMTPSQVTDRLAAMMSQGQYAEALDIIEKRTAQRQAEHAMGSDVQLLFLRGRALAGLGRHNEAIEHYLNMTTQFPELPEPWNNLAAEYVKQGRIDMAQDALQMALTADPNYTTAKANLGWVRLMQAHRSFEQAPGSPGASQAAQQTQDILSR